LTGNFEIAQKLLDHGALATAQTTNETTPVELARQQSGADMATHLSQKLDSSTFVAFRLLREIQQRLWIRGFDPGRVDGVYDKEIHTAIRRFSAAARLENVQEPDEYLLAHLIRLSEESPIKGYFAAFALDEKQLRAASVFRASDGDQAFDDALKLCQEQSLNCNHKGHFRDQCVVYVRGSEGWFYSLRDNIWWAREAALAGCGKVTPDCRVQIQFCSDGSYAWHWQRGAEKQ
jgi:hypothetical protein